MMIYYPEIYYGEMNEKQGRWGAPVAISVTHGMGLKFPVHARRAQYEQFYFCFTNQLRVAFTTY